MKIKNKLRNSALALLTVTLLVSQMMPAQACSFSVDPYFTYTNHPDFPLKRYAAGNLGVIQSGYARSYLLVAYRYLAGLPLSAEEQDAMVTLWDNRLLSSSYGCQVDTSAWLNARKTIPGTSKIDSIDTEKSISAEEDWQTYCNCQTPAFVYAAQTLKALITKYGANSDSVKQWVKAQDDVFSDCGNPPYDNKNKPVVIPTALPDSADPLLKQHRAYQIAAANFYSQKFDAARSEFQKIAADQSSPWHQLAGYLAVRCTLRKATLSKQVDMKQLSAAKTEIQQLISKPEYAAFANDLDELNSYVAVRLNPAEHLQDLAKRKFTASTAGEITKTIDNIVGDTTELAGSLVYDKFPATVKAPEMIDWVMTVQAGDETAKKHAVAKWKETHSNAWLVAAMALADADDAGVDGLIAAADKEHPVPARATLAFHINRLNIDKDKDAVARQRLDKLLASPPPELSLSSINAFKTQRLALSQNLNEFVKFGLQNPVCICSSGGVDQVPDDIDDLEKGKKASVETAVFTPEAGDVMDNKLPLSVLKTLAQNTQIPANLRGHIAWTSFVRAILIGDDNSARALALIMKPFNKSRQKLVDSYLAAATPAERKFAADFMMLQYSSAQPMIGFGPLQEDAYGDASGWWWYGMPVPKDSDKPADGDMQPYTVDKFDPLFLSTSEEAQAKAERSKLAAVPVAPNYFAKSVLAYAQSHPADPRVPQALHFLVKSTKYGSTTDATKGFSKQAFNILHTKYKGNPWTVKTPYFY